MCTATFVNFTVATPYVSGQNSSVLSLTCTVAYATPQRLGNSIPLLQWYTYLSNVDVSDQTVLTVGALASSNLNLNAVNSSYCGIYYCSAMDLFTGLPSIGNITADILTGIGS